MGDLAAIAEECDRTVTEARARFVDAIRQASREGLSQAEIAFLTHRSQPEISRLLRFHGSTPRARALIAHRRDISSLLRAHGGRDLRVFGSVATGTDSLESDIDLLFDMRKPLSLFELGALEQEIAALVKYPVDLVPEQVLRPDVRDRVLAEAVAL